MIVHIEKEVCKKENIVAPGKLFFFRHVYQFNRECIVEGVYPSKFGNIDFKHVFIRKDHAHDKESIF